MCYSNKNCDWELCRRSFLHKDIDQRWVRGTWSRITQKNLNTIDKAFKDVEKKTADIDEIVLVYRSLKVSKMRQLIKDFFNNEKSKRDVNLDKIVIYVIIVWAEVLREKSTEETKGMLIIDVSSIIIWIETAWNIMNTINIKD